MIKLDIAWVEPDDAPLIAAVATQADGSPRLLVKAGAAEPVDLTASVTGTPEKVLADNRGASTSEYALIAALVILVATSGITTLGEKVGGMFARASGAMAAASVPAPETETNAADASLNVASEGFEVHVGETRGNFLAEHRE